MRRSRSVIATISFIALIAALVLLAYEFARSEDVLKKILLQTDTTGARIERVELTVTERLKQLEHPVGKPPEQQR